MTGSWTTMRNVSVQSFPGSGSGRISMFESGFVCKARTNNAHGLWPKFCPGRSRSICMTISSESASITSSRPREFKSFAVIVAVAFSDWVILPPSVSASSLNPSPGIEMMSEKLSYGWITSFSRSRTASNERIRPCWPGRISSVHSSPSSK